MCVCVLQLPFTRKWLLAESLTITRLAYTAHTDAFLNISGTNLLRSKYMHIVRTAAGCIPVPEMGKNVSDAEALSIAEALPWEQLVAIERLRYAGRLLQHAPQCLMALLEQLSVHKYSWTHFVFPIWNGCTAL